MEEEAISIAGVLCTFFSHGRGGFRFDQPVEITGDHGVALHPISGRIGISPMDINEISQLRRRWVFGCRKGLGCSFGFAIFRW